MLRVGCFGKAFIEKNRSVGLVVPLPYHLSRTILFPVYLLMMTSSVAFRLAFLLARRPATQFVTATRTLNKMSLGRALSTRSTHYVLNTGAKIPALGFGTFQDPDAQEDAVNLALQTGIRNIDTARV